MVPLFSIKKCADIPQKADCRGIAVIVLVWQCGDQPSVPERDEVLPLRCLRSCLDTLGIDLDPTDDLPIRTVRNGKGIDDVMPGKADRTPGIRSS